MYKEKLRSDGSLERLKAGLVILGDRQRERIYYKEIFPFMWKIILSDAFY